MKGRAQSIGAAFLCAAASVATAAEPLGDPPLGASQDGTGLRGGAGVVVRGNDRLTGSEAASQEALPGGTVSLNLVDVPLPVAAKAVLADTMGWGYTLDAAAGGTLTLQTGGPVARGTLLAMFEAALSSRGLVLRRRGRTAQILPAGGTTLQPVRGAGAEAGAVVVPLRWISAAEMQAILAAVAPRDVVLRADRARNVLILNGDAGQIRTLRQTIEVFDVDWMRGMSTAMLPVRSSNPRAIARDLTQIFGGETAGTGDVIRFVPNEALSAVLVVTSRAVYLDRARVWLAELETLAADRERQLFVYRIQNRSAKELAAVLQGVVAAETGINVNVSSSAGFGGAQGAGFGGAQGAGFGGAQGAGLGAGFGTGPDSSGLGSGFGTGAGFGSSGFGGDASGLGSGQPGGAGSLSSTGPLGGGAAGAGLGAGSSGMGAGSGGTAGLGAPVLGAGYGGGYGGGGGLPGGYGTEGSYGSGYGANQRRDFIGIVADEVNNSLVVSATRNQYDKILRILGRLDAMPTQVLLETVIAEVTLNDQLQFGVQWFLQNRGDRLNLSTSATANTAAGAVPVTGTGTAVSGTAAMISAATRGVPGFNYLMSATNFNVVLNALQGITRVHVLSSPNITVLDNRTAKLQIGDQVPIVKQSGQSALAAGAPILNQIELKDTGVILSVTPRVNKNGLVVLDINQEVSDVVPTTTSTINSPTIRQRRVATSVAVNDGHTLALGGLVQEKSQLSNESLPILGDLPLIGPAFRNRDDQRVRTELIVFIRPKVIRGTVEADRIADDFRQQFKAMMPVRPVPPPPPMAMPLPGPEGLLRRMMD
ncbi:type II secretion system secretin GspD [Methylobacterium persicinum]|uniref:General secretion pathway protein D n=1 Tax=Methylobacterium persicinum TaxID=374426 RepID=A0ABU0HRW3_9HYPH|nr:type II secretion system secretin GspD [Methylobacterium persicinum]MDQ0444583.1 general secretion pathway protein D [Methylobacterium persicinum]GJE40478.1 Type 3 secretion system secretin [Methylobacterium persicinum]